MVKVREDIDYLMGWVKVPSTLLDKLRIQREMTTLFMNEQIRKNPSDEGAIREINDINLNMYKVMIFGRPAMKGAAV